MSGHKAWKVRTWVAPWVAPHPESDSNCIFAPSVWAWRNCTWVAPWVTKSRHTKIWSQNSRQANFCNQKLVFPDFLDLRRDPCPDFTDSNYRLCNLGLNVDAAQQSKSGPEIVTTCEKNLAQESLKDCQGSPGEMCNSYLHFNWRLCNWWTFDVLMFGFQGNLKCLNPLFCKCMFFKEKIIKWCWHEKNESELCFKKSKYEVGIVIFNKEEDSR